MDTIVLYIIAFGALILSFFSNKQKTTVALKKAWKAFEGILPQFIIVLFLVAAVLAALDTETISKLLGNSSGFLGVLVASLVGSVTLIPGFVAFPAAAALLQSGAGATQMAAFISSLMMVGIVTLPMEMQYFGKKVAMYRNIMAWFFSLVAAYFVGWMVSL